MAVSKVAYLKASGMTSEQVIITPALSREWVAKRMVPNRTVSDAKILTYYEDMKAGRWTPSHQGIAINPSGMIIDGEHRIRAIALFGDDEIEGVELRVTYNVPDESRANFDSGKVRTVADNFKLETGNVNSKKLTETATVLSVLSSEKLSYKASVGLIKDIYQKHKHELEWAVSLARGRTPGARRMVADVRGAIAFAYKTDPTKVQEFANKLMSGAGLDEGSPILVLINLLSKTRTRNNDGERRELSVKVLRAIVAHLLGEKFEGGKLYATEDAVAFFGDAHGLNLPGSSDYGVSNWNKQLGRSCERK